MHIILNKFFEHFVAHSLPALTDLASIVRSFHFAAHWPRVERELLAEDAVEPDGLAGWSEAGEPVVESANAKVHARGEVTDVRPLVVDREHAYGGVFNKPPVDVEGAGG